MGFTASPASAKAPIKVRSGAARDRIDLAQITGAVAPGEEDEIAQMGQPEARA
jgi:hypothetical protein